jgi:transcriptional regulator with XRE-family HTH domain/sugar lactone lactonase YvrE
MDVEVKNKANRRHVGHNLQKIRVYFGMKQEALAADLGVNQQVISKIEKQEEIEEGLLNQIASVLGISAEVIKDFDVEKAIYNINNIRDNTFEQGATSIAQQFNPLDKIVELYERLLQSEREKIELLKKRKLEIGLSLFIGMSVFWGCNNDLTPINQSKTFPPDLNAPSVFESFSPDSGGIGTQLIIRGKNFGSDPNYVKVTVNNKEAAIVGMDDEVIYAIVPARADTGYVRLFIGKDDNIEEYASETKFRYQFKRNVTTMVGQHGMNGREDGSYANSKLQRTWFLLTDKDGTVFFVDEGRGQTQNGALRRARNGEVETLVQCSSGPFQSPTCLAFSPDQDTLYISQYSYTDEENTKTDFNIIYVTREGGFVDVRGLCRAKKVGTTGLAVHPKTGEVFFCNKGTGYIYRYDGPEYEDFTPLFRINNAMEIETRMTFNSEGTILYVAVCNRHCIYQVPYDASTRTFGVPVLFVGAWDESGYVNGTGATVRLNKPEQMAFDEDGNMFVPERNNHIIRKITPAGSATLYAGRPEQSGFGDGLPEEAKFNQPECVTVYPDNSIYVADRDNHVIRRVTVE